MKIFLLAAAFIGCICVTTRGQVQSPPPREQSNIEKFSAKSGTLIERQFVDVGTLHSIEIKLLILKDLMSAAKISGVRFEYNTGSRYGGNKSAFLDPDEIDGLIKSVALMKNNIFSSTRDSYTEVTFKSRSGFQAGCYFSDGKWTAFVQVDKYDNESMVTMRPEDFDQLLSILEDAKKKLG